MLSFLAIIWSLIPVPIGLFCLYMGWKVHTVNKPVSPSAHSEEEAITITDQELSEHFGGQKNALSDDRSQYFAILFLGLGLGSVLIGLSLLNPVFPAIGKIVIFVTIISSFLGTFFVERHKNKKAAHGRKSETTKKPAE